MTGSFDIVIQPGAQRQLAEASTWWKANRTSAPDLLDFEFSHVIYRLSVEPLVVPVLKRGRYAIRRMHMRKTRYHVYYVIHPRKRTVDVIAVWSARRGTAPSV